jgi:hypothetical protein
MVAEAMASLFEFSNEEQAEFFWLALVNHDGDGSARAALDRP